MTKLCKPHGRLSPHVAAVFSLQTGPKITGRIHVAFSGGKPRYTEAPCSLLAKHNIMFVNQRVRPVAR